LICAEPDILLICAEPYIYLILQSKKEFPLNHPDLSVRIHSGTPEPFLHNVCELIKEGTGFPKLLNDEEIIPLFLLKGATWEEARSGFKDLLTLFIVAQIFASFWGGLTGRKRNPYDPLSILTQWTFGGLAVGIPMQVSEIINDISIVGNPLADESVGSGAYSCIKLGCFLSR